MGIVEELSACLWEERAALEQLVFRLEQENLVLAAGRHRLLDPSTAEVATASAEVDRIEQRRLAITASVGEHLGLGPDATLETIADTVDDPLADAMRVHRQTLRGLVRLVTGLVESNRELIARGLAAATDALALVGAAPPGAYTASGGTRGGIGGALMLDARA
ncbi:MAG TPA: flagellar export chaperone FlgN [Acidimicrobiales bacterium]|nr:flagellar export chaperone FlgN [Acidimicrobiales bacterium]